MRHRKHKPKTKQIRSYYYENLSDDWDRQAESLRAKRWRYQKNYSRADEADDLL